MNVNQLNKPLLISLAALAALLVLVVLQLPALLGAVGIGGFDESEDPFKRLDDVVAKSGEIRNWDLANLQGRALFYGPEPWPPAPVKPRPVVVTQEDDDKVDTGPPPAPSSYPGKAVVAVFGDEVWFSGGLRVKVGEEKEGHEVIAANPPWSVTIGHSRGEYDIDLLDRKSGPFYSNNTIARGNTPPDGLRVNSAAEDDSSEERETDEM